MQVSVDGAEAYLHTGGRPFDPHRRAMVLIHGAGFDHTAWRHQARYLAHRDWSVAAVDLPGHGRSGGPPVDSVDALAEWVRALLDALGCASVVVVGHSMGSLVALEVAARDERVAGLVLLSAAEAIPVHPDLLTASAAGDDRVLALLRAWEHASHPGGNPVPGNWMMGEGWRLREAVGLGVLHADLVACNEYARGAEAAAAVTCPVLLMGGEGDRMVGLRATRALAALLADGEVVAIGGAGHALLLEAPRVVAHRIDAFGGALLPA